MTTTEPNRSTGNHSSGAYASVYLTNEFDQEKKRRISYDNETIITDNTPQVQYHGYKHSIKQLNRCDLPPAPISATYNSYEGYKATMQGESKKESKGESKGAARGRYKCSRCGNLKTNHDCPIIEEYAGDISTQCEVVQLNVNEFQSEVMNDSEDYSTPKFKIITARKYIPASASSLTSVSSPESSSSSSSTKSQNIIITKNS